MDNLSAIFSAMMDKPTQVNFNNFSACSLGGRSALNSFNNKLATGMVVFQDIKVKLMK